MSTAPVPEAPRHPFVKVGWRYLAVAVVLAGVPAVAVAGLSDQPAHDALWLIGPFALAAVFAWGGLEALRAGPALVLLSLASERITRGQVDDAERLIAQLPPRAAPRKGTVRGVALLRANIALHRGDATAAAAQATLAAGAPTGFFARDAFEKLRAMALALRALAHASLGRKEETLADAAAAESSPMAPPDAHARAALARAVLFAQAGDMPGLAALLAKSASPMLESLLPRERVLVRAMRRMARSSRRSVYREAAKQGTNEEAELAAWVAKVAPSAAAFAGDAVARAHAADAAALPPPSPEARRYVERARQTQGPKFGKGKRMLVLWVLLVVMFLAIWQLLQTSPSRPSHVAQTPLPIDVPGFAILVGGASLTLVAVIMLVAVVVQTLVARGSLRRLTLAKVQAVRGEVEAARHSFAAVAAGRGVAASAEAHLGLAGLAERAGDFAAALDAADRGLGRIWSNGALRALHSNVLVPELLATRVAALSVLGRNQEAAAELAALGADFPAYPGVSRARYRAALYSTLHPSQFFGAPAVARTRTLDMPLSLRDDVLTDVILAATDGVSQDELERIAGELRDDDALRAWIDRMTPGLRDRMHARAE